MRFTRLAAGTMGVVAALAIVSGCAGNSTPAGAPAVQAFSQARSASVYRPMLSSDGVMSVLPAGFRPKTERPAWMKTAPRATNGGNHLAVAQFGASSVLWFEARDKKNAPPSVCEPASSTNGIRIDRRGNLWVPDGRADTTTEYAPNCGAALLTIPDSTGEPADVAFDRKGRTYILNLNNTSGPPTVAVYDKSAKQVGTLSDPSFAVLFGVGSDNDGNIFVSNLTSGNVGNVVEFPAGKMPGTALAGVSLGLPGTPAFDRANNLIISDWNALTIDVFSPPYTHGPSTSPLMGQSIWCPLDHRQTLIFCGDAEYGSIDVYRYPGATYLYSYSSGLSSSALVTGVAADPPASY